MSYSTQKHLHKCFLQKGKRHKKKLGTKIYIVKGECILQEKSELHCQHLVLDLIN